MLFLCGFIDVHPTTILFNSDTSRDLFRTGPGWMTIGVHPGRLKEVNYGGTYHSNGDFFEVEESDEPVAIPTGIPVLDAQFFPLFRGILRGGLTEIVGLPGSGKTLLAYTRYKGSCVNLYRLQTCIQALALDPSYAVIYIDSNANFSIERITQIYRAQPWAHRLPISDFMARMFPIPVVDIYDLMTVITLLPAIIRDLAELDHYKVALIVIDNVASPMRLLSSRSIDLRMHLINKLARDLRKIACQFNTAILTLNQMTKKKIIQPDSTTSEYRSFPSLGITWNSHMDASIHIGGEESESIRHLQLVKSVHSFSPLIEESSFEQVTKPLYVELGERGFYTPSQ